VKIEPELSITRGAQTGRGVVRAELHRPRLPACEERAAATGI
jgi:hypothetical protein